MKAYNRNRPCVNTSENTFSHFVLFDDEARFSDPGTQFDSASDDVKQYSWSGQVTYISATKVVLRLQTVSGTPLRAAGSAGLDSGQISITLTDGTPVEDIAVDYVDDAVTVLAARRRARA